MNNIAADVIFLIVMIVLFYINTHEAHFARNQLCIFQCFKVFCRRFGLPERAQDSSPSEAQRPYLRNMLQTHPAQRKYLIVNDSLFRCAFQFNAGERGAISLFRDAVINRAEKQIVALGLVLNDLPDAVART